MMRDMVEKEIIRRSFSSWLSSLVLIRKSDGSLRLCLDCRRLTELTREDSLTLPTIDTTFNPLCGAEWFSTLDLVDTGKSR